MSHPSIVDHATVVGSSDDVVAGCSPVVGVCAVETVEADVEADVETDVETDVEADVAAETSAPVPWTVSDRLGSVEHAAMVSDMAHPAIQSSRDALRDAPSNAVTAVSLAYWTDARTSGAVFSAARTAFVRLSSVNEECVVFSSARGQVALGVGMALSTRTAAMARLVPPGGVGEPGGKGLVVVAGVRARWVLGSGSRPPPR